MKVHLRVRGRRNHIYIIYYVIYLKHLLAAFLLYVDSSYFVYFFAASPELEPKGTHISVKRKKSIKSINS